MKETAQLAEFAVEMNPADVPADVRRRASMLVLDLIGCQIAGIQMPWSKRIHDTIAPLTAPGGASVVQYRDQLAPDGAAFINSAFAHSNESDDTHLKTPTHPGAVIIPTAMAVAESLDLGGEALLNAVIVGYEVMLRVSYSVSPHLITQGHHPPPAVGPFGAAAAASRLMGLNVGETLNALAIAGSHSAGLQEYTQTGGSVKRLHCAIPAQAGIRSALLARNGVTGPPTVLEGERGFTKVFSPERNLDWLTRGLGSEWILMETAIKGYSCCHLIHPALDSIVGMRTTTEFDGPDVESIEVHTTSAALVAHVGVIVEPQDILGAQFSMGFSLALMLYKGGCGFWDFFNADLADPAMLDLSRRTKVILDGDDRGRFATGLVIKVKLKDGTVLEADAPHAHGEPEWPLTDGEIRDKFLNIAGPVLGADAKNVAESIENIAEQPQVADIARMLAG